MPPKAKPDVAHPATVGVLALLRLLDRRGCSIAELQEHLGRSRSSTYRMVAAIEAAGVEVERLPDEDGVRLRAVLPRSRPAAAAPWRRWRRARARR